jgi:hypothetical protein
MKHCGNLSLHTKPFDEELDELLHPARLFARPWDVVDDPDLKLDEKRAILASWASDACAVEAAPALRRVPDGGPVVSVDEILEALCTLDRRAREPSASGRRPRQTEATHARAMPDGRYVTNVN